MEHAIGDVIEGNECPKGESITVCAPPKAVSVILIFASQSRKAHRVEKNSCTSSLPSPARDPRGSIFPLLNIIFCQFPVIYKSPTAFWRWQIV